MPSDKKRIFKNAIALYARLFVTMGITLYASRVLLENLGIEDYGVYNIVGAIAVFFAFFNQALASATQRFMTVAIGKGSSKEISSVYSMAINCHILIASIIFIVSEIGGVWFVNYKLHIPEEMMVQANWVFQLSLLTCVGGILNAPFNGTIIGYEKLGFFAITGLLRNVLKLAITLMLVWFDSSRIVYYSLLLLGVTLLELIINRIYCGIKFKDCRYAFGWNRPLFREMISFSGWNVVKMGASIGANQCYNIILNIFGGPVANAAMGIASQVAGAVFGFMNSVQSAFSPQITKTVARDERKDYSELIILSSKLSAFMMIFISLPIALNIDVALKLWLGEVPANSNTLSVCYMASVLLECFCTPLETAIYARGSIRRYQLITSTLWVLSIAIAWIALKAGVPFQYILVARIIALCMIIAYAMIYVKISLSINIPNLIRMSLSRVSVVLIISSAIGYLSCNFVYDRLHMPEFFKFAAALSAILVITSATILIFGLSRTERQSIRRLISNRISRRN